MCVSSSASFLKNQMISQTLAVALSGRLPEAADLQEDEAIMHMLQLTGLTLEVDMSHVVVVVVRRWPPIGLPASMTFTRMNCASNYATQVGHATLAHSRVQRI